MIRRKKKRRPKQGESRRRRLRRRRSASRRKRLRRVAPRRRDADGSTPVRVSVIIPSYNQAAYIRDTIESVLRQDYPHVEILVMDGGSTDGTVDILHQYAQSVPERFRFVSEPDRGQAHAVNKGVAMAAGTIIGWLNSDDTYHPGAIAKAVRKFRTHPNASVVYGNANYVNERGEFQYPYPVKPFNRDLLMTECFICQPAAFLKKDAFVRVGGVKEDYKFILDYELWLRLLPSGGFYYIDELIADYRLHEASKSMSIWKDVGLEEVLWAFRVHYGEGAVAAKWVAEYAHHHWPKGVFWLLNRYKANRVFGRSPELLAIDRYEDGWVPAEIGIVIGSGDPNSVIHSLLIKGRHAIPDAVGTLHLTVYVNKDLQKTYEVNADSFVLVIPIHAAGQSIVNIRTEETIRPLQHGHPEDDRVVGFIAEEIVPLSAKEYEFYEAYNREPSTIPTWLLHNK